MAIEIELHLIDHCIETESKNEFKRLMDDYFSKDVNSREIEEKIKLIRDFIELSDFKKLRSSDRRLSGGEESYVILKRESDGIIRIDFQKGE